MRVITIGRSSENDIVIQDPKVSRTHLQLVSNGSNCSVVDLNSANGTYVNGKKISGEVHLSPNDTIRIGDTNLPWQTYINNSIESIGGPSENIPPTPPRNNKKLWIIIAISALIILGGIAFGIYHYQNQKEKERIEKEYEEKQARLEDEARQKEDERKKEAQDQEEYKDALREDRDANKKLADDKAKEAEIANAAAAKAQKETEEANKAAADAKKDAEEAIRRADKAKKQAQAEAENAKKAAEEAERNAKEAESAAKADAEEAKKSEELTEQFYEEYLEMKESFAKQVCIEIKKNIPNNTKDVKVFLKNAFTKSDNTGKQKIIDAIKKVKSKPDAKGGKDDTKMPDTTKNETAPEEKPSTKK